MAHFGSAKRAKLMGGILKRGGVKGIMGRDGCRGLAISSRDEVQVLKGRSLTPTEKYSVRAIDPK